MRFWFFFTIITLILLALIGYIVIVPKNIWRVAEACNGRDQKWVSSLTPAVRILEESNPVADQIGRRTLLAEPVYLEVTPPRPFAKARLSLEVQNLPADQKFGLGVVSYADTFVPILTKTNLRDLNDNWQSANAEVLLSDIQQTPTGSYKFLISAPNFTDRVRHLVIRNCTIEFSGWPTWKQLTQRYVFRLMR